MPGNPAQALVAQHPHLQPAGAPRPDDAARRQAHQSLAAQYVELLEARVFTFNFGISITTSFGTPVRTMVLQRPSVDPRPRRRHDDRSLSSLGTFIGLVSGWRRGSWLDSALPPIFVIDVRLPVLLGRAAAHLHFLRHASGGCPSEDAYNFLTDSPGLELALYRRRAAPRHPPGADDPHHPDRRLDPHHAEQRDHRAGRRLRAHGAGQRPEAVEDHVGITPARNAILPNLTGFAMSLGFVVSGAILVEYVFNYPGVGTLLLQRGKASTTRSCRRCSC